MSLGFHVDIKTKGMSEGVDERAPSYRRGSQ